jgi:hypothetical protein
MPVIISAATSGATTLQATDAVTATITLPSATDTLVGKITPSFTTTIGVGAATPSASGAGITFPATQSASTDANTLDDYEEGTWTPSFVIGTPGTSSFTYTLTGGKYVKIGQMVYVNGAIYTSAASLGTGSGNAFISGLPFTNSADTVGRNAENAGNIASTSGFTTNSPAQLSLEQSDTKMLLWYRPTLNGDASVLQAAAIATVSGVHLMFSMTYRCNI